ncbi:MAG TPA: glutamine synthetase beta-grasp domain-containing protein [Spirochaetia bacterium]|nr:glutamine synthetase beta-grasp domain-containing protein [Spirochaetaceae bacterium]HRW23157.1 glutamine synthetase beta-grasp domain-containing protein [Spirochaetia bacterium]
MKLSKYSGDLSGIDYLSLLVIDINGAVRSVSLPRAYVSDKVLKGGIGFDASNFGYAQVHKSDMVAIPDLSTGFVEEKDGFRILHAFCDVWTTDGEPFDQYPRTVARKAMEALRSSGVGDDAKMLVELEFYAFDDARYSTTAGHSYYYVESAEGIGDDYADAPRFGISKGYHRLAPDDRYGQLRNEAVRAMEAAGIPVKYHHHEVAASQLEIELNFISLASAGDAVVLAKWIVRSVAEELGLFVTFMPKPMYKVAGSGMHVHQYVEKDGRSVFPGDGLYGLSQTGLAYTAGVLSHALSGSLLAWSNPSTNSYRRLVPGYEAPVSATFAQGSRAAAVRIPGYLKKGEARIEFRTGDATANTYYFLAAMLLAGLDGVSRGLDPVKLGYSSTKETPKNTFPTGLFHVLSGLRKDCAYLKAAFPAELIDSWIAMKQQEAEYVYNAPVPQEYELYF